ncbi:MAG: hypothetical protein Q8O82_11360 [Pseudorhodobacter sp.]|nr:hypothetical protein [Pseudorhodobacter sp.]
MIGWITTLLASGLERKALGMMLAAFTIVLFLLNLRRAGEIAGRLGERLQASERTHEIQRQMLDAASRRPHGRDDLLDRLRDGGF